MGRKETVYICSAMHAVPFSWLKPTKESPALHAGSPFRIRNKGKITRPCTTCMTSHTQKGEQRLSFPANGYFILIGTFMDPMIRVLNVPMCGAKLSSLPLHTLELERIRPTMSDIEKNHIVGSKPNSQELPAHEYWTPERRAAAKPVPPPKPGAGERKTEAPEGVVEPGHTPSGKPRAEREGGKPEAAGGNPVANPKLYPYSTCGKLFFTQGGEGFAGSAAVVSRNVILTAGHCVHQGSGGSWSSNVVFYPSYPLAPALHFSYNFLAAWKAWTNNGNRAFDYGMIWVDNNPGDVVGWLGLLWNASTSGRVWDAVGYPATPHPPFDGNHMDEARGTFAPSATAGTIGLNNDNMEHGSSGGPWITDFNGATVYANGLQSFHIHDGDFVEYGPYFTSDVKSLLDWISNPANRH